MKHKSIINDLKKEFKVSGISCVVSFDILYVVPICLKLCTPYHGFIQMCLNWIFHVKNDLACQVVLCQYKEFAILIITHFNVSYSLKRNQWLCDEEPYNCPMSTWS